MVNFNLFFAVAGFEHNTPVTAYISMYEMITNSGSYRNTELLYALMDITDEEMKAIISSDIPKPIVLNRDNNRSIGLIRCITKVEYDKALGYTS